MFSKDEISFFNSKANVASSAAGDKPLPQPTGISRLLSSKNDAESVPVNPRVVIRGSFLPKTLNCPKKSKSCKPSKKDADALKALLNEMFFDWFQFTLPSISGGAKIVKNGEDKVAVQNVLIFSRKNGLHALGACGGNNGYGSGLMFSAGLGQKETVAKLNTCSKTGIMPNVQFSGGKGLCAKIAPLAQQTFYGASLSRADVSYDISQEGLFDDLYAMACSMSEENKKIGKPNIVGKLAEGMSFYLGSKKSVTSIKVYQKDMERAKKGEINWIDADPHLVRIEVTFRPQSNAKKAYFKMSPADMIATSAMAREFMSNAAKIMNFTDQKTKIRLKKVDRVMKEKTLETTVRHGFKQYAPSIMKLATKNIIDRDYGGKVNAAKISPIQILQEVQNILFPEFHRAIDERMMQNLIVGQRVDKPRSEAEDDVALINNLYNFDRRETSNKKEAVRFVTQAQAQLRFDHKTMFTPEEIAVAKSIKRQNKKLLKAA